MSIAKVLRSQSNRGHYVDEASKAGQAAVGSLSNQRKRPGTERHKHSVPNVSMNTPARTVNALPTTNTSLISSEPCFTSLTTDLYESRNNFLHVAPQKRLDNFDKAPESTKISKFPRTGLVKDEVSEPNSISDSTANSVGSTSLVLTTSPSSRGFPEQSAVQESAANAPTALSPGLNRTTASSTTSKLIPGTAKNIYPDAPIDVQYQQRFPVLVDLFRRAVDNDSKLKFRAKDINYELRMCGITLEQACPTIIVFCVHDIFERLRKLFNTNSVKFQYQRKEPGFLSPVRRRFLGEAQLANPILPFSLVFWREANSVTKRRSRNEPVKAQLQSPITICGSLVVVGSCTATVSFVVSADSKLYGVTVDHIRTEQPLTRTSESGPAFEVLPVQDDDFQELQDLKLQTDFDEERDVLILFGDHEVPRDADMPEDLWVDDVEYADLDFENASPIRNESPLEQPQDWELPNLRNESNDNWDNWEEIGHLVDLVSNAKATRPYLDWALIEFDDKSLERPNALYTEDDPVKFEFITEEAAGIETEHTKVIMVSGVTATRRGTLLPGSAFIGGCPGQEPCEVLVIDLLDSTGIIDGDCGSLIVSEKTMKAYGHVVAANPLGQGYVVPIRDTLIQIGNDLGVKEVFLPNPVSIMIDLIYHYRGRSQNQLAEVIESTLIAAITSEKVDLGATLALAATKLPQHDVPSSIIALASKRENQGDYQTAMKLLSLLDASQRRRLGSSVTALNMPCVIALSRVLQKEGCYQEAMVLQEQLREFMESTLGDLHRDTVFNHTIPIDHPSATSRPRLQWSSGLTITDLMSTVRDDRMGTPLYGNRGPHVIAFQAWMNQNVLHAVTNLDSGESTPFVPIPDATGYLAYGNNTRLDDILEELFDPKPAPVDASTILSNYVAVFCILVEIGYGSAIAEFVNRDWNDHRLPCTANETGFPSYGESFHQWFYDVQLRFCVPNFTRNMNKDFDGRRILPIAMARKVSDQGGDATIYEIRIHSLYNKLHLGLSTTDLQDPLRNTFALKRYTLSNVTSYNSEIEAFRRLSRNPHLIDFHGNYTQVGSYNILLRWADQGSLEQFLSQTPPPSDRESIINFWTSLLDIFKALYSIHQSRSSTPNSKVMNGWHQDVKPRNVLVISNGAASPYEFQFKLGDLGLTHFHASVDDGGSSTADDANGTQTYGAPECYRPNKFYDDNPRRIKQRADIWSFGCVLSEAAVWVVKGYESVLRYRGDREMLTESISKRLGDCFHDGEQVLPTVFKWHKELTEGGALRTCDQITPLVLRMIENEMLRAASDRLDAEQLSGRVEAMLNSVRIDHPSDVVSLPPVFSSKPSILRRSRDSTLSTGYQKKPLNNHPESSPIFSGQDWQYQNQSRAQMQEAFLIISGYEADEPDAMSINDERNSNIYMCEDAGPSRPSLTQQRPRPATHPIRSAGRPSNQKLFASDPYTTEGFVQRDLKGFLIDEETRPHSAFGLTAERGGKEPAQDYNGSQPQRPWSPPVQLIHPKMPTIGGEQYGNKNNYGGYFDVDGGEDLYDGGYTRPEQNQRLGHKPRIDSGHHSGRFTPNPQRSSLYESPQAYSGQSVALNNSPNARISRQSGANQTAVSKRHKAASRLPELSMGTAIAWRDQEKGNNRLFNKFRATEEAKLPGNHLFGRVGKRDHVFIIDDAETMKPNWDEMCQLFGILAYMVKHSDEDGIDVYFTMSDHKLNNKNVTSLVTAIQKRKQKLEGGSNINLCLGKILAQYDQELRREIELRKVHASAASPKDIKPLTVYVLTNGRWGKNVDPTKSIKNIVKSLVELRCASSRVGIQFISFGADPTALARLDYYDNGLGLELDIVDHTRSNGNLWKMILGAIDENFDEPDDEDDDG